MPPSTAEVVMKAVLLIAVPDRLPGEETPVLADRANGDAPAAGREKPFVEVRGPFSAGPLFGQRTGIIAGLERPNRAELDASHAAGAEILPEHRVRREARPR